MWSHDGVWISSSITCSVRSSRDLPGHAAELSAACCAATSRRLICCWLARIADSTISHRQLVWLARFWRTIVHWFVAVQPFADAEQQADLLARQRPPLRKAIAVVVTQASSPRPRPPGIDVEWPWKRLMVYRRAGRRTPARHQLSGNSSGRGGDPRRWVRWMTTSTVRDCAVAAVISL